MRSLVVSASFAVLLSACSGSDTSNPVAACNSFASAICAKASSCNLSGITSACAGDVEAALNCSAAACPSGQSFNSGAASDCVNAINGLSCTDAGDALESGNLPTACNSVCH